MTVDIFDLRIAMKDIESKQDDMALRWVMLKMWLDKQEAAQQSAHAGGETIPRPTPDNQTTIERQVNDPWCKKCAGFHKPNEACY